MKKLITGMVALLAAAQVFASVSTNENGQIIETYTNAFGQVTFNVIGTVSTTVSPWLLTPDTNGAELNVAGGGTFVIDPDETSGTVSNTLSAARHGEVLRLIILPATNTFQIYEGTTGQFSGGLIEQTGAGTNDLIELWGVGTTWREAYSSTLVE